jgi:WD40 repeat protein
VRIWNVLTAKPHANLRGHSRPVLSCAISPDARQVLSGGQENQIKLWDLVNYKEAPPGRVLEGHEDAILAAAFSPDGARVVTASRDHTARVYVAETGQCSSWLKEGHEFLASRALFFDEGRRLVTAGGDNTVRIWDAATGAQLYAMEGTGRNAAIAVSPDSNWILTGKYVRAGGALGQPAGSEPVDVLRSSPQIALWELNAKRNATRPHVFSDSAFGTGHPAIVTVVAISPDARLLFSGDDAGVGILWNAATGAQAATLVGHTGGITGAAFLPDGRRLLTASKDGTVARWDVASGKELTPPITLGDAERRDAYDTPVTAIAVSRDGRQVLTLSEDTVNAVRQSTVRLWNVENATLARA